MLSLLPKFAFILLACSPQVVWRAPDHPIATPMAAVSTGKTGPAPSAQGNHDSDRPGPRSSPSLPDAVPLLVFGIVMFVVATGIKIKLPRKHFSD